MKVGIIGAGGIASTMAYTLSRMNEAECAAVASRNIDKAKAFAAKYGIPKAYGSYEELCNDKEIELVYIATPHSLHYDHVKLCLMHGKNVLCEKAFTANYEQAHGLIELAEKKNLLLTEAMWTRYIPMRKTLDDVIHSGVIGEPMSLTANLGYKLTSIERLREPKLAGGALLDLGVYCINFARMVFGAGITGITSSCIKSEQGVDQQNSITLHFGNKMATLFSTMMTQTDRRGMIYGTEGYIEAVNINNIEKINVFRNDGTNLSYDRPEQITGLEYEILAAYLSIMGRQKECPEMPHTETLAVMDIMDKLRAEWDIRYPFE